MNASGADWVRLAAPGAAALAALGCAELLGRRRWRRFGDPEVLGHPPGPARRLARALLMALALGAAAPLAGWHPIADPAPGDGTCTGGLTLVVDRGSLAGSADPTRRRAALDTLEAAVALAPAGACVEIVDGPTLETIVPPTPDRRGCRLVLDRPTSARAPAPDAGVLEAARALATRRPGPVLALAGDWPGDAGPAQAPPPANLRVALLGPEAPAGAGAGVIDHRDLSALRAFVRQAGGGDPAPRNRTAAGLAALALGALVVETLLGRAGRRKGARLPRPLAPAALLLVAATGARAAEPAARSATFVQPIAPGISIVTHVSDQRPRAGQQISLAYSLRAEQPPGAVDVLAQQYAGFWTETLPLGDEGMAIRERDGRTAYESLLRQVIAYPLEAGALEIPPLVVRLRLDGAARRPDADWDLEAASAPVALEVAERPSGAAVVGTLQGRLAPAGAGALRFDLEGTVQPAFLDPDRLVRVRGGWQLPARLADASQQVEVRDMSGTRTLQVVYRRTWTIPVVADGTGGAAVEDLVLEVLAPGSGLRGELRLPGFALPGGDGHAPPPAPEGRGPTAFPAGAAVLAALAALAAAWLAARRTRGRIPAWARAFPFGPLRSGARVGPRRQGRPREDRWN